MKNKIKYLAALLCLSLLLTACSFGDKASHKIGVLSDNRIDNDPRIGQISQSIEALGDSYSYTTHKGNKDRDYMSIIERLIKKDYRTIIGSSFVHNTAFENMADQNEQVNFIVLDSVIDPERENLLSVRFKSEEAAFIAGYAAGLKTKSNMVGFIGVKSDLLNDYHEYGFKSGILAAAEELNKQIALKVEHIENYSDFSQGQAKAKELYEMGIDIIYHTGGESGLGVDEVAEDISRFTISYGLNETSKDSPHIMMSISPDYKMATDQALRDVVNKDSKRKAAYGFAENSLRLNPYIEESYLDQETYNKILSKIEEIKAGKVKIAFNEESYKDLLGK